MSTKPLIEEPGQGDDGHGSISFLVRQILSRVNTATLVKVVECTTSGQVGAVGFVDVQPMVNQIDGSGNGTALGKLCNIPYFRIQGGSNAIIMDPKAGDVGIAVFCSHDISKVKNTKAQANPGSWARFSMSDGLYLGGFLNGAPTQYIQFTDSGISIKGVTINLN